MRMDRWLLTAALVAAMACGCDPGVEDPDGEGQGFAFARVEDACSGDDGPALEFRFGLDAAGCDAGLSGDGWLRIAIWDVTWEGLSAGNYPVAWNDGVENGGAWYSADGDGWVAAGGWIEISGMTADSVTGTYEVTTDDGEVVAGSFESIPYCDTEPLCG